MAIKRHLLVLSSPSGGGKSTVARHLLLKFPKLKFSVSATTRKIRERETEAVDYYFMSKSEFKKRITQNEFVEYEEIFGNYYGTLKETINYAQSQGECLIFDIDVKGALSLKREYSKETLLVFITPPNIRILEERLRKRSTETEQQIAERLARAEEELTHRDKFDFDIINDKLNDTLKTVEKIVKKYAAI